MPTTARIPVAWIAGCSAGYWPAGNDSGWKSRPQTPACAWLSSLPHSVDARLAAICPSARKHQQRFVVFLYPSLFHSIGFFLHLPGADSGVQSLATPEAWTGVRSLLDPVLNPFSYTPTPLQLADQGWDHQCWPATPSTNTSTRKKENRDSIILTDTGSEDGELRTKEMKMTDLSRPWYWSTVLTSTPFKGKLSDKRSWSALTCALYGAITPMSVAEIPAWERRFRKKKWP